MVPVKPLKLKKEAGNAPIIKCEAKSLCNVGGSRGLVVMGGDSCSECCRFESQHRILDWHFFTHICCQNCNVCLKRQKYSKRGWERPIFINCVTLMSGEANRLQISSRGSDYKCSGKFSWFKFRPFFENNLNKAKRMIIWEQSSEERYQRRSLQRLSFYLSSFDMLRLPDYCIQFVNAKCQHSSFIKCGL